MNEKISQPEKLISFTQAEILILTRETVYALRENSLISDIHLQGVKKQNFTTLSIIYEKLTGKVFEPPTQGYISDIS